MIRWGRHLSGPFKKSQWCVTGSRLRGYGHIAQNKSSPAPRTAYLPDCSSPISTLSRHYKIPLKDGVSVGYRPLFRFPTKFFVRLWVGCYYSIVCIVLWGTSGGRGEENQNLSKKIAREKHTCMCPIKC